VERREVPFNRYPSIRKCDDLDIKDRIKAARDECKASLTAKLRTFTAPSCQVLEDLAQASAGTRGIIALVRQFDREFSQAKRARRILDFSDLEHKTLDLLLGKHRSSPTAAAEEIGRRFREIMVDEYQDSNAVQDAIFEALTGRKQNCFMVGDVKQSIYQFRLADPGIFLDKYGKYADAVKAQPREGRKILLSRNFRSGGEVIEAVNDIFVRCMSPEVGGLYYGGEEALREGIPHEKMPDPAVELCALQAREESYGEEAAFVAQRIRQMLEEKTLIRDKNGFRPVKPDDIVILLRSPGSAGRYFQKALGAVGIRCTSGGGEDLLQTAEIATLRSFLETIYNPRQDIPLLSVLASPVFGFTADELAAFRAKRRYGCIYDALIADDGEKSRNFVAQLKALRREARMNTLSQLLEKCYALTAMDSIYGAMPGGEARAVNLQTFFQLASDYEMGNHRCLGQFLDHLRALEEKGLISAGTGSAGCVTIMSIHKSKGLEFPVVFLSCLSRRFNRDSLQARILSDKELGLGLSVADTQFRMRYPTIAKRAIAVKMAAESLSEELRVLYVAVTRARDRLIMTYMHQNLENKLRDLVLRADLDGGNLLTRDVSCPGDWVLLTALHKTEAGELFALGGRPRETTMSQFPWKIETAEAPVFTEPGEAIQQVKSSMPKNASQRLKAALEFSYPYASAMEAPSKQTATGRKGRAKDEEAAEDVQEKSNHTHRAWRRPGFLERRTAPKTYGNAMHAAMQFIRYGCCEDEQSVAGEIARMVKEGFLSEAQGDMVNCADIAAFFETEEGKQLQQGAEHIREFKFSILDDASRYGSDLPGEKVLLQGVVDCALITDAGITVIDFKTDRVTEKTAADAVEEYRLQVETYAEALSRIYELPILAKKLYFFRLKRFVDV
jgi:ATP-dependent helicase/nuclease subunit A